eukprot:2810753-Lingulodinium_polyedra.AAC.1
MAAGAVQHPGQRGAHEHGEHAPQGQRPGAGVQPHNDHRHAHCPTRHLEPGGLGRRGVGGPGQWRQPGRLHRRDRGRQLPDGRQGRGLAPQLVQLETGPSGPEQHQCRGAEHDGHPRGARGVPAARTRGARRSSQLRGPAPGERGHARSAGGHGH